MRKVRVKGVGESWRVWDGRCHVSLTEEEDARAYARLVHASPVLPPKLEPCDESHAAAREEAEREARAESLAPLWLVLVAGCGAAAFVAALVAAAAQVYGGGS